MDLPTKNPTKKATTLKKEEPQQYEDLKNTLQRFTTKEVLCESAHEMSTQKMRH